MKYLKFDLTSYGKNIGYLQVYYNNDQIINKSKKEKEIQLNKFHKQVEVIEKEVNKQLLYQIISFLMGGTLIVWLIIYLLIKFVNKPLIEFQKSLNSFFSYLADPTKKVEIISIDTKDEFGQMSSSINNSINVSMHMHREIANLMKILDKHVILSETDLKGNITYVSEAFCKISGFTQDELIGKSHRVVRNKDMPSEIFAYIWLSIQSGETWEGEIKNTRKDGTGYWVYTIITPKYNSSDDCCGYTAIRYDITSQKEVEYLKANLEVKIEERTTELEHQKENTEQILSNILLPMLITSREKRTIVYANQYAKDLYDSKHKDLIDAPIDSIYTLKNGPQNVIQKIKEFGSVDGLEEIVTTHTGKEFSGLLSVIPIKYNDEDCYIGMTVDITKQKEMENQIRNIHKHTKESIEYSSLIQQALIPDPNLFNNFFNDSFTIWEPKDIVGGDIYLLQQLSEDECLLMVIDCTGHGVPGAFITMLVKAIEREIIGKIFHYKDTISTSKFLSYFNKTIKKLLKQDNMDSISNAGFDGGILYYNKKEKIIKFSGAETPLFYIDKNHDLQTIKGSRHSVGYKKCDPDYQYKETTIEVEKGMKFYLTTDGYLDQNGGEKDFPFGKKRFSTIIKENFNESMKDQKDIFLYEMNRYEKMIQNNDRNDDMTLIGFEI